MTLDTQRSAPFNFDPASPLWAINRELVLLLGGAKAAILQVAYPEVAYGVAAHSNFKRDALGRLIRTLEAVYGIVFGTPDEAARLSAHVRKVHAQIHGDTPHPYNAFSQDAQMWVIATLTKPGLEMYERYVGPVPPEWLPVYYRQMRQFGTYFGLNEAHGPQTWDAFCAYYDAMMEGPVLASDPLSAKLARAIIQPDEPYAFRLALRPLRFLAEEFLDSPVRERLGFRSRVSGRIAMRAVDALLPRLLPWLPKPCRYAPKYLKACRILDAQTGHCCVK